MADERPLSSMLGTEVLHDVMDVMLRIPERPLPMAIQLLTTEMSAGKRAIATAIKAKEVDTSADKSLQELADDIMLIENKEFRLTGLTFAEGHVPSTSAEAMVLMNDYLVKIESEGITALSPNAFSETKALVEVILPNVTSCSNSSFSNSIIRKLYLPNLVTVTGNPFNIPQTIEELNLDKLSSLQAPQAFIGSSSRLVELNLPSLVTIYQGTPGTWDNICYSSPYLKKVSLPMLTSASTTHIFYGSFAELRYLLTGHTSSNLFNSFNAPKLIHVELNDGHNSAIAFGAWSPTMSLRTDTTASDYIDLREDKDEQGEFINATNLEQFLANFRKYIIIRLANRTGQTALTLTLSAAVYQNIYGLDSSNNTDNNSWARTHTLADLGLTADDLTDTETAAGITINTIYATWLDTYRAAINWNIGH